MVPFVWLGVIVLAALVEMATPQLVSVWFAVGGVGGLIACLLGAELWVQILIFACITAVSLAATRPLARKMFAVRKTNTNADRYIGQTAFVTAEIDNTVGTGQVNVLGSVWTARSADGTVIPAGRRVRVEKIDGVKLMVRPKPEKE